jgi:hypothetical protein
MSRIGTSWRWRWRWINLKGLHTSSYKQTSKPGRESTPRHDRQHSFSDSESTKETQFNSSFTSPKSRHCLYLSFLADTTFFLSLSFPSFSPSFAWVLCRAPQQRHSLSISSIPSRSDLRLSLATRPPPSSSSGAFVFSQPWVWTPIQPRLCMYY